MLKLFEVLYALYCARRVVYLIPEETELRRLTLDAIHAAEAWVLEPTAENRQKCRDAADVAWAAARAAYNAAYDAARAAGAAADAAWAAEAAPAADPAARAADAAWAAARAVHATARADAARAAYAARDADAERKTQREWYDKLMSRQLAYLARLADIERLKVIRQREILEHCTNKMLPPLKIKRVLL